MYNGTKVLWFLPRHVVGISQVVLVVRTFLPKQVDVREEGLISGLGRSPGDGHGNPLLYSYLENPMDRGVLKAVIHRVAESWT